MRKADRSDIDAFREAALKNRNSTNAFEMRNAKCEMRNLYIAESQAGTFLLFDADGFFRLYYTITDTDSALPQEIRENAMPIIAETPYRGDDPPPSVDWLIRHGFEPALTRFRMSLNTKENSSFIIHHFSFFICDSSFLIPHSSFVLSLFSSSFDRQTGCLPTLAELELAAAEGRVIAVEDGGNLCGALLYENAGKVSSIRNVAVAHDLRGRGFGSSMIGEWISRSAAAGISVLRLWVAQGNAAAISLYQKHGFAPDGLKSAVSIKK